MLNFFIGLGAGWLLKSYYPNAWEWTKPKLQALWQKVWG